VLIELAGRGMGDIRATGRLDDGTGFTVLGGKGTLRVRLHAARRVTAAEERTALEAHHAAQLRRLKKFTEIS